MARYGLVTASVALVAIVACLASAAAYHHGSVHHRGVQGTADLEHNLHGLSEAEIKRELHYVYSWGYESPPPPEHADHLTYYPPKEAGTVRHQRILRAEFHRQREADFKASEHGLPEQYRRHLEAANRRDAANRRGLQAAGTVPTDNGDHRASAWAPTPFAEMDNYMAPARAPSPMMAPDCNGTKNVDYVYPKTVNVTFNATVNATSAAEARFQLRLSLQQPSYPIGASASIFNTTVYNTLQQYGTYPRYSKKFGLAMKASNGRWFTYVDADTWWWGADDWSTNLWTCRYYQPGPNGFDCKYDRTCPGCDRCRGEHCYTNRNKYTYCADKNCKNMAGVVFQASYCMQRPIWCGMSRRVGDIIDIGWPGYGAP